MAPTGRVRCLTLSARVWSRPVAASSRAERDLCSRCSLTVRVQQWTAAADAPELYGAPDMPNTRAHDRMRV
jgi:hypothetical protein